MVDLHKGCNWKKLKLSEASISIQAGGTPRRNNKDYWDNGAIPWLKISDLKSKSVSSAEEKITKKGLDESAAKLFPKGTIVYTIFATLGEIAILDFEASSNQAIAGIVPNNEIVDTNYLYYCLKSETNNILQKKSHGTQDNINLNILRNHEIPTPPLPVQKRIAAILERAEALRQKRQETNEETDKIVQSLFYEMFGDPQSNEKEWQRTSLFEASEEKPQYGSGAKAVTYDNKIRYIRITDIDENGNLKDNSVVSPSEFEQKYLLKRGDLLFARSGATVGKTYLHQEEKDNSVYAGYMIRFRFKKDACNPQFIFALTKTEYYKNWLLGNQTQVAQPNINAQQYGGLKIILPPIELQDQFVSIVEKIESVKQKQRQSTQEINVLFEALMQKAFKGELAG